MKRDELKETLTKLFAKKPVRRLELSPESPFDIMLQERIASLEREVQEVKDRVNGLLFLVIGAVIVQVVLKFLSG